MKNKIFSLFVFLIVASFAQAQSCIWTDNPKGPSCSIIPQKSNLDMGTATNPFRNIYGTITGTINGAAISGTTGLFSGIVTAPTYNLTDGSDKNFSVNTFASGTAYALTNTSAALDFGTSDPTLVLSKAGTYLILAKANLEYAGATFAANRTVTLKLRRTNNTAADLTGSSTAIGTNIVTTVSGVLANDNLPPITYTTTNTNDIITIFGDVSVVPTAGALNATEANIQAVRLY